MTTRVLSLAALAFLALILLPVLVSYDWPSGPPDVIPSPAPPVATSGPHPDMSPAVQYSDQGPYPDVVGLDR